MDSMSLSAIAPSVPGALHYLRRGVPTQLEVARKDALPRRDAHLRGGGFDGVQQVSRSQPTTTVPAAFSCHIYQNRLCLRLPPPSAALQGQVDRLRSRKGACTTVYASQGLGETPGSVSTSTDGKTVADLKRAVMTAVSNTNRGKATTHNQRQAILQLIEDLEKLNPTGDPVDSPLFSGRWALLYTAPVDEKTADKYAGTEEGPFLARVKPAAFGSVRQIRSTQILDTLEGTAQNIADFVFFGINGSLNITGSVCKAAPTLNGAVKVDVAFKSFVLKLGGWTSSAISLGWINPTGWIETTFLDADMRIGRGDKGSVFVAVRSQQA